MQKRLSLSICTPYNFDGQTFGKKLSETLSFSVSAFQGLNHELILIYQDWPFGHMGNLTNILDEAIQLCTIINIFELLMRIDILLDMLWDKTIDWYIDLNSYVCILMIYSSCPEAINKITWKTVEITLEKKSQGGDKGAILKRCFFHKVKWGNLLSWLPAKALKLLRKMRHYYKYKITKIKQIDLIVHGIN